MNNPLVAAVRSGLGDVAQPGRAPVMQAYMKSKQPYLGVAAPDMRKVARRVFTEHPIADCAEWQRTVLDLFRHAQYREERYVAIELAGWRRHRACQTPAVLPMYEEMITTGAWWDLVDGIASHRIGDLLRSHPKEMRPLMLSWSRDPHLWKRRSAIICQIRFKKDTDLDLLYRCIEVNLADRDFFIRKAIGWALRAYAWVDPAEVTRYVALHEKELSGLSRREALKNVAR